MSKNNGAGKGDLYRKLDMDKFRKNYDEIWPKSRKKKRKSKPSK